MAIEVQLKMLSLTQYESDQRARIMNINAMAMDLVKTLKDRYTILACTKHPGFLNVLTIRADETGTVVWDKSQFCCDEFRTTLELPPK